MLFVDPRYIGSNTTWSTDVHLSDFAFKWSFKIVHYGNV